LGAGEGNEGEEVITRDYSGHALENKSVFEKGPLGCRLLILRLAKHVVPRAMGVERTIIA
jgi:hypothetical protein